MDAGFCFADERMTEEETVHTGSGKEALTTNANDFNLLDVRDQKAAEMGGSQPSWLPDADVAHHFCNVENPCIVSGELLHRDRFVNASRGNITDAVVAQLTGNISSP